MILYSGVQPVVREQYRIDESASQIQFRTSTSVDERLAGRITTYREACNEIDQASQHSPLLKDGHTGDKRASHIRAEAIQYVGVVTRVRPWRSATRILKP